MSNQPKPVLDRKAAEQLNLSVLKRMDPDTEEVGETTSLLAM